MSEKRLTRRDMIKKAVYITPAILTLTAAPSFASGGSGQSDGDQPAPRGFAYGASGQDNGDHPGAPGFAYGSSRGKGGDHPNQGQKH